jgi:hypothetical protein
MTVKELKQALTGAPDFAEVVFQGNVKGEYDEPDSSQATHTTCTGDVFSAWLRDNEFVIDARITDSEY